MAWQSLYDWCIENGEWGEQLLHEFGEGNNEQIYENPNGMPQCPQDFSYGTNKKIKWTCKNNNQHVWEASVYSRVSRRTLCPFCSGRKASEDNNLLTWCEQNGDWGQRLINEWTGLSENNEHVKMTEFTKASGKRVKWKCSVPTCSYEWVNGIHDRTSHRRGCPLCASNVVIEGKNDLKTFCLNNEKYRHLIDEWTGIGKDESSIKMTAVSRATAKKVLWHCSKCDNEWYASISDRTSKHRSMCPKCMALIHSKIISDSRIKTGENDLLTWCNKNGEYGEKIEAEFTGLDEFGNKIDITQVTKGSNKKILWHCNKNHEWHASVNSRTCCKSGCPFCNRAGTSYPEQALYRSLKQLYPNTINRGKFNGYEYDIMITDTTPHVYIEYSAINYHINNLDRDELKASICKENNIRFIQIYAHSGQIEIDEDIFDENQIIYRASYNKEEHNKQLTEILQHILNSLGHNISEINIEQAQTEAFNFMHDIEETDEEDEPEDF